MSDFVAQCSGMTANEILNFYRNYYYKESVDTEQGLVAAAINEILPTHTKLLELQQLHYNASESGGEFLSKETLFKAIETFQQCYSEHEAELTPMTIKMAVTALDMMKQFVNITPGEVKQEEVAKWL